MITGNVLYFGYGTIGVDYNLSGLALSIIQPPQEIGFSCIDGINDGSISVLCTVSIPLTLATIPELKRLLNSVDETNCKFIFNGYVFNFEKFNAGSIRVILKAIDKLCNNHLFLLPYAC